MILYCVCMIQNVTTGPTFWFFNGALLTLKQSDGNGNPYSRNNVPSPLIIPSFVTPHEGNYSCGPTTKFNDVLSQGDTITLALPGMFL